MPQFHHAVAPGPRAKDIAYVRDRGAELVLFARGAEVVTEGAAGVGFAVGEEGLDFCVEGLELAVERGYGGTVRIWRRGDDGDVVGDEVG